jgi:hypothetical protein
VPRAGRADSDRRELTIAMVLSASNAPVLHHLVGYRQAGPASR